MFVIVTVTFFGCRGVNYYGKKSNSNNNNIETRFETNQTDLRTMSLKCFHGCVVPQLRQCYILAPSI